MLPNNKNIIWIASYPKSGNTWFRLLLSSVLNPGKEIVDINNIESTQLMAGNRSLIDRISGTNSSDLTEEEIFHLRAQVYRKISEENNHIVYAKVHDAWQVDNMGYELFPSEITKRVVLIVRNPFDISVSFSNHSGISIKQSIAMMNNTNYKLSGNQLKLSSQLCQYISSWSEHFRSWVDRSGLNVLVVRYEDMFLEPTKTFSKALEFLDIKTDFDLLDSSIKKCSFDVLQKQENEYGFYEKPIKSSMFFNVGQINYWNEHLDKDDIKSLNDNHSEILKRLDYTS